MRKIKIFSNTSFDLKEEITSTKVDQIDDEVLGNTNSIPPGIEYLCFNAESDLLESLLHRDTSINDSQKIDSLLDEFAGELTLRHSIPPGIDDVNLDPEGDILFLESLLYDNSSPRPPEEFNTENPTREISFFSITSGLESFQVVSSEKPDVDFWRQHSKFGIARIVKALVFSVLSIRSLKLQILSFILGIPIS
ncbi:hypothetical protein Tco_0447888 [Tanacetum coccineum]